ncbi:MAG: hypothetical protein JWN52_6624 [Actinomycetia bacterium]|nr:hypothetical protein [Actinomycetes bacterium]
MGEIRWYSLNRRTEFPGDVQQCGECCAIVHDANVTGHTDWHEHLDSRFTATSESELAVPADWPPQLGDLWREVDGALWFAQSLGGSQMSLIPAQVRGEIDQALPAYVLETFGPLILVHRDTREAVASDG